MTQRIEMFVLDKIDYETARSDRHAVDLPIDARFACADILGNKICVWIYMGTCEATCARTFVAYATGEEVAYRASYLATVHDKTRGKGAVATVHLFEQDGLLSRL